MSSSPDGAGAAEARAAFDFQQLAPPPREAPVRLEDAASRAGALLASAQMEAERIRDAARAQGFEEGRAAGRAAAQEELRPAASAIAEALLGMRELKERSADDVERA